MRQVLAQLEVTHGRRHLHTVEQKDVWGEILKSLKRWDDAEAVIREVLEAEIESLGEDNIKVARPK